MTATDANSGTAAVSTAHRFDAGSLQRWMDEHVAGFAGPMTVEQFKGGQSNPTYKLTTPKRSYVLRRKPPGPLLKGAHAIDREAKVLAGLREARYPVAEVHGLCLDDGVIGTAFYVMDMIEGRIFWDATLPEIAQDQRSSYFDAMVAGIAELHDIDYRAVGLGDYGKPGNYFQRQISRWTAQYKADAIAGRDPHMDLLIQWLPDHIPEPAATAIVHGDFRIDNLIFHPCEPRILAVLDWELSTLGDPLADFAYHAMMYRIPPHIVAGLAGADLARLNLPSEQAYVSAYCRRRGLTGIADYDFYLAFNAFRLAAIFHGIKARAARGTASSAHAQARALAFPELAAIAWRMTNSA